MTHLLSYAKHYFEMQPLQKPLVYSSTGMSIFLTFILYFLLSAYRVEPSNPSERGGWGDK
jgi:hypothetical protein